MRFFNLVFNATNNPTDNDNIKLLSYITWHKLFSLSVSLSVSLDSIRTMNKYNDAAIDKPGATLDTKLDIRLKQCRGQRNFYITGFSLFLML